MYGILIAFIFHIKSPVAFGTEKWRMSIYIDPINVIKPLDTNTLMLTCLS